MIGHDQQETRPYGRTSCLYSAHSGSFAMSSVMTGSRRYIAVPHEPAAGPIASPIRQALYAGGSDGPIASAILEPVSSSSTIEPSVPTAVSSIDWAIDVR